MILSWYNKHIIKKYNEWKRPYIGKVPENEIKDLWENRAWEKLTWPERIETVIMIALVIIAIAALA